MKEEIEIYFNVIQFVNKEVGILDDHDFHHWLELLTDDVHYVMARRLNKEGDFPLFDVKSPLMEENYLSLTARVEKLYSKYSWSEIPPSRYRHYVTNVRVGESKNDVEISIRSNVIFMRNRLESADYEIFTYERRDILRKTGEDLKLCNRLIIPDQPVLSLSTISNFY